jgi:hypothetical protein
LRKSVKECGAGHHTESRSETSGRSKEVDGLVGHLSQHRKWPATNA